MIIISSISSIIISITVVVVRPVMITTFVEPYIVPETTVTNEINYYHFKTILCH